MNNQFPEIKNNNNNKQKVKISIKTAEELRAPCLELTHENELVSKFLITIEEEDPE